MIEDKIEIRTIRGPSPNPSKHEFQALLRHVQSKDGMPKEATLQLWNSLALLRDGLQKAHREPERVADDQKRLKNVDRLLEALDQEIPLVSRSSREAIVLTLRERALMDERNCRKNPLSKLEGDWRELRGAVVKRVREMEELLGADLGGVNRTVHQLEYGDVRERFMKGLMLLWARAHGAKRVTASTVGDNNCYAFIDAAYVYATGEEGIGRQKRFQSLVKRWHAENLSPNPPESDGVRIFFGPDNQSILSSISFNRRRDWRCTSVTSTDGKRPTT